MSKLSDLTADIFLKFTGHTYSNLARLFMRLFVGIMFMQFGIRQLTHFWSMCDSFPTVFGLSSQTCLILMIVCELVCSLMIMTGFLMRMATIPPIFTMIVSEWYIVHDLLPHAELYGLDSTDPGYLPIMFIGIYLYLLLAGPGKISLDYLISISIIARRGHSEEETLEEV